MRLQQPVVYFNAPSPRLNGITYCGNMMATKGLVVGLSRQSCSRHINQEWSLVPQVCVIDAKIHQAALEQGLDVLEDTLLSAFTLRTKVLHLSCSPMRS